jgi:hypothetical protein
MPITQQHRQPNAPIAWSEYCWTFRPGRNGFLYPFGPAFTPFHGPNCVTGIALDQIVT